MLNTIIIQGRIVRDPELRRTGSGIAVASFTVAVDRDFAQDGNKETDFIDCVAWRQTGEFVSKYFKKGSMIVVKGRLQIRGWTDKDGNKRKSAEVVADNCYFGSTKSDSDGSNNNTGNGNKGADYCGYTGGHGGGAYSDTMAEIERQRNNGSYGGGYGSGYSAAGGGNAYAETPYGSNDYAYIEDDDEQLPF